MSTLGIEYLIIAIMALSYIPMFWSLQQRDKRIEKLEERLREKETCKLTACHSRDHILELVERALAFYKRELVDHRWADPVCIAFLDLDNLKKVNDSCGHAAGDALLATFSATLQKTLHRQTDAMGVGRLGGDEFVVVLPGTHPDEANRLLTQVQADLEKLHYAGNDSAENDCGFLRFSFGVSSTKDNLSSKKELLELADKRMYENKEGRRPPRR